MSKKSSRLKYLDRTLLIGPYMALCTDEETFKRECKRLGIATEQVPTWLTPSAHATTHHFINTDTGHCHIVCIKKDLKRTRPQIYALLTHEAYHVWCGAMEYLGEKNPGEEIVAYGIQNISQSLMEAYEQL